VPSWRDLFACRGALAAVRAPSIDIGGVKAVVLFIGGVNPGAFDGALRTAGSDFGVLNDGCGNAARTGVFSFPTSARKARDFFNAASLSSKVAPAAVWNTKPPPPLAAGGVAAAALGRSRPDDDGSFSSTSANIARARRFASSDTAMLAPPPV
jgi:hypothetical protein